MPWPTTPVYAVDLAPDGEPVTGQPQEEVQAMQMPAMIVHVDLAPDHELDAGRLVVDVLRQYAAHHEHANPAISSRVRECLDVLPPEWSDHDTGERT